MVKKKTIKIKNAQILLNVILPSFIFLGEKKIKI
jgi:hypothetical protein